MESTFKLYFEEREEYEITPSQKILLSNVRDRSWQKEPEKDLDSQVQEDLEKAENILSGNLVSEEELTEITELLKQDICAAAAAGRSDLKLRLIECKEKIISWIHIFFVE